MFLSSKLNMLAQTRSRRTGQSKSLLIFLDNNVLNTCLRLAAKSNTVTFSIIQKFILELRSKVKSTTVCLLDIQSSSTIDTNYVWGQE